MAWIDWSGKTISWKPAYLINEKSARAIVLALLLVLGAAFSIHEQKPPPEAAASVSPDLFSAGRAIRHLAVIAEKPHPIGSIHHATVRDYLVKELSAGGSQPGGSTDNRNCQKGTTAGNRRGGKGSRTARRYCRHEGSFARVAL